MSIAPVDSALVPPAFVPRRWLSNGHVMSVFAWGRTRRFPALPAPAPRRFRVADDSEVLAQCYWQADPSRHPVLVALHGLEGSARAHYMLGLAEKAFRLGWSAVLLNQRNCGGTESLSPRLYHSGLTTDPAAVVRELAERDGFDRIGLVGYSLGGNLALRLCGELGASSDLPVRGVVGVSPTIDLASCVRAIERRVNLPYQWNFMRQLRARMRRMAAAWPGAFDLTPLDGIWTIRRFDDVYTAPHHGFGDAANYYFQASAMRVIEGIRRPALILTAGDDPFVPASQFSETPVTGNPAITVRVERHGGHCGFVGQGTDDDGYWAESAAVRFLAAAM